mmetsp:Transcript_39438/g.104065  ORF Transcript_39438/g.104065 Transcript_39438/m.104065 type:complete len:317 (-) Transcript_39438:580-1530(-)|eukprot:CAMPEP_0115846534 /NCGR_PEP_ID=MMETSP0287-20121206/9910_1 /TAXON_ID=412157 /ORGANISM="Chrysochromulina rotalis, Strain UIO044" /LENGTH=316 /DNA_ID=CAMNT_0003300327 /DNA_START=31 /DNA_END=981 /DNA_ORIENTATION=-
MPRRADPTSERPTPSSAAHPTPSVPGGRRQISSPFPPDTSGRAVELSYRRIGRAAHSTEHERAARRLSNRHGGRRRGNQAGLIRLRLEHELDGRRSWHSEERAPSLDRAVWHVDLGGKLPPLCDEVFDNGQVGRVVDALILTVEDAYRSVDHTHGVRLVRRFEDQMARFDILVRLPACTVHNGRVVHRRELTLLRSEVLLERRMESRHRGFDVLGPQMFFLASLIHALVLVVPRRLDGHVLHNVRRRAWRRAGDALPHQGDGTDDRHGRQRTGGGVGEAAGEAADDAAGGTRGALSGHFLTGLVDDRRERVSLVAK